MKFFKMLKDAIGIENPVFISFLALCPMLATSNTLSNALGMGISVLIVLLISNTFISIIRKLIPSAIRFLVYIIVIATLVTAIEMFIQTFIPSLYNSLGIYLPLIVANCLIIARAEKFAMNNSVINSIKDGLVMGISFALSIIALALFREILATGKIEVLNLSFIDPNFMPSIFQQVAGAFLALGILAWIFNTVIENRKNRGDE